MFVTFLWDYILIKSNESQIYGIYKENNYHPINEIFRFISYMAMLLLRGEICQSSVYYVQAVHLASRVTYASRRRRVPSRFSSGPHAAFNL